MNIIDAISDMREAYSPESDRAKLYPSWLAVGELVAAYDALAPDWSNAPDDAVAYAIDADGLAHWFVRHDGLYANEMGYWFGKQVAPVRISRIAIPVGIDWRLCKWQRPEVKS